MAPALNGRSGKALPVTSRTPSKKARVIRILKKKEPQLIENTKHTLIIKGNHTSETILDVLSDVAKLVKPNCKVLGRKNEIYPFDDANSLEFLTSKNDCSLFAVGSHSKKRPNNLILVCKFGVASISFFCY